MTKKVLSGAKIQNQTQLQSDSEIQSFPIVDLQSESESDFE